MSLFNFNFEENTLNSYAVKYMKKNGIDYIYNLGCMYADVYGLGIYFKVLIENIGGNRFECSIDADNYLTV